MNSSRKHRLAITILPTWLGCSSLASAYSPAQMTLNAGAHGLKNSHSADGARNMLAQINPSKCTICGASQAARYTKPDPVKRSRVESTANGTEPNRRQNANIDA